MDTELEMLVKRLWLAYRLYHKTSVRDGSSDVEYATKCVDGYMEYLYECSGKEGALYDWGDWTAAVKNQIRIITGFTEVYDRQVIRDKKVLKTRWSL